MLRTILLLAALMLSTQAGIAQDIASAQRPRFLASASSRSRAVEIDPATAPVFQRRVTLALERTTVGQALAEIGRQANIQLVYSRDVIDLAAPVRIKVDGITVAAVLTELLLGRGVDLVLSSGNRVTLSPRWPPSVAGAITGRVTDSATGRGVTGAEAFLEKTRWRAATDTNGWYHLSDVEPGSYTLTVRRLGYRKWSRQVTLQAGGTDTLDVTLQPMAARLTDLVTTATGQRRRVDIANDITTINADSVMQAAPIRSLTDLLETRVPDLSIQRTSGAPGDPARLRLRGVSSPLGNNDPIVIVDGIRIYARQSDIRNANLATPPQNLRDDIFATTIQTPPYAAPSPLDYIDPNTIETIEVLKGPSAATLYGQDAANGVIVITTKRGRAGPPSWTASAEYGRTRMAETEYPTLYLRWGHDLYAGTPNLCPITNSVFEASDAGNTPCVGDSLVTFQLLNDPTLTPIAGGHRADLSLGVSGGTSALTYALNGSYQDEVGLLELPSYEADRYRSLLGVAPPQWMRRPLNLKQWGVASTVTARLGAKAEVTLSARLTRLEQQKSSLLNKIGELMSTYLDRSSGQYYQGAIEEGLYPISDALRGYFERATATATAFTNSLNLEYRPRPWLALNADAGFNVDQRFDGLFFPRGPANVTYGPNGGALGANDTTGYVRTGHGTTVATTLNLRANAMKSLGRGFLFRMAVGANYAGTSVNDVRGGFAKLPPGSSLTGDSITYLARAEQSDATFGWYAEPSVGNSKFNFTSGLRLDGGSTYGSNVSGLSLPKFPKLGFSYLVSDESWFPFKTLFQSLRLRLAYGQASRQPRATDRLRLYSSPTDVFADSQVVAALALQTLGNPDVRPERSSEFEGGFDADVLDSRVTVSVTGARKTTTDALLEVPVAPSVYGDAMRTIKNIGVIRNTSLSLTVGTQLLRSDLVTWGTEFMVSQRRDVVVSLGHGIEPFYTTSGGVSTVLGANQGGNRVAAGYPLFGRWSLPIAGYADVNGDGAIALSEVRLGDTAVYVGNPYPNYEAALHTTLSFWRGALTVNGTFSYQDGMSQRNELAQHLAIFSPGRQVPGTPLDEQIATMNLNLPLLIGGTFGYPSSDYNWIQTVNTLRFNSVSVSYAVPAMVARRIGVQSLSIAVQGSNLGLWTNYSGLDPNVNAFGTGNNVTDAGTLPQPRTWQLQVRATY